MAFFTNEFGRVYIGRPIIRQAVEPELSIENKFQPSTTTKNPIDISFDQGSITASARLAVAYGVNIQTEAPKVQERIKRAVEILTGLSVSEVTVNIERVFAPSESHARPVKSPKESKVG